MSKAQIPPGSLLERLVQRTGVVPNPNSRVMKGLGMKGVQRSHELDRIIALPRRVIDLESVPDLTPLYVAPELESKWVTDGVPEVSRQCTQLGCDICFHGPPRLLPLQSLILLEAQACAGALGSLPVGSGKTLASLLLPDAMDSGRAVLLVPASTRDQLTGVDIPRLQRHFRLPVDRLTVVAYSELSLAKNRDMLDQIQPDLIVADEAHHLKHRASARTKRVGRYLKDHPGCRFVPLTGTVFTGSVKQAAHLSEWALRKGSPFPIGFKDMEEVAAALDPGDAPLPPGALLDLCNEDDLKQPTPRERARAGFKRRLQETPGVVMVDAPGEDGCGASLVIRRLPHDVSPVMEKVLADLRRTWKIGDDEIDDPMRFHAVARTCALGFHHYWEWEGGKPDEEWLEARGAWNIFVRDAIRHGHDRSIDTPLLVAQAVKAGRLPAGRDVLAAWERVKDRPGPETKATWFDRGIFERVFDWIEDGGGIIWYEHQAVEVALREAFYVAGEITRLPIFGAGTHKELSELAARPQLDARYRVMACSIRAHSTGKNLQRHWSRNLVLEPPANGEKWEQLLGRTHRRGQPEDEVDVVVPVHTRELRAAVDKAVEEARLAEQARGQRQKLLLASRRLDPPDDALGIEAERTASFLARARREARGS